MNISNAQRQLEVIAAPAAPRAARAFRAFPRDSVDLLCVEEPARDVRPRMHSRFAIVLLQSPAVVRLESSRSIVADRNWILLVPARHLYAMRAPTSHIAGAQLPPITLQVGPSHLEEFARSERPAVVTDADVGDRLASLIVQFQRPVHLTDCEAAIESIIERVEASSSPIPPARDGFAMQTLAAVRDYLRARLSEQVSTESLSRFSGLTESHLIRAFHREFGLPPHAYHLQLRLAHACELLADSLSVSTAAYECGFADQSHLSRKFKQAYGLTPAAWANAVRGDNWGSSRQAVHADMYSSR